MAELFPFLERDGLERGLIDIMTVLDSISFLSEQQVGQKLSSRDIQTDEPIMQAGINSRKVEDIVFGLMDLKLLGEDDSGKVITIDVLPWHSDAGPARRAIVLKAMAREGVISEDDLVEYLPGLESDKIVDHLPMQPTSTAIDVVDQVEEQSAVFDGVDDVMEPLLDSTASAGIEEMNDTIEPLEPDESEDQEASTESDPEDDSSEVLAAESNIHESSGADETDESTISQNLSPIPPARRSDPRQYGRRDGGRLAAVGRVLDESEQPPDSPSLPPPPEDIPEEPPLQRWEQKSDSSPRRPVPADKATSVPPTSTVQEERMGDEENAAQLRWGSKQTQATRRPGANPNAGNPGGSRVRRPGKLNSDDSGNTSGAGWQARRGHGRFNPPTPPLAQNENQVSSLVEKLLAQSGGGVDTMMHLDLNQLKQLVAAIQERIAMLEQTGDPTLRVALQSLLANVIAQSETDDDDDGDVL